MTTQPGWHPDPVPPAPGSQPQLRYWDGTRWTEHVASAQAGPTAGQGAERPAAYSGTYGATPYGGGPYGQTAGSPYAAAAGQPATTPDGALLAGWWQRVLASIIDAVILGVLTSLVALPWWRQVFDAYRDWLRTAIDSSNAGGTVDVSQLQSDVAGPLLVIGLIGVALNLVYVVAFLMWRQATPGKLVLGLRVRLRERPGPMPLGTVLVRWLTQYGGPGALALVPFVGYLTSIYTLLDDLWPLWDDKKQAIHDKAARTNVVRTR